MEQRAPSGLFPSSPRRPTFREPHPVRAGSVLAGVSGAAAWLFLVGLLASSARMYVWLTVAAALVAWAVAVLLMRLGDRGVAVGIACTTALAVAVAVALGVLEWRTSGFPLW